MEAEPVAGYHYRIYGWRSGCRHRSSLSARVDFAGIVVWYQLELLDFFSSLSLSLSGKLRDANFNSVSSLIRDIIMSSQFPRGFK